MPHVELPQAEFKVVMLGETNTGKTSLVLRFAEGYFPESGRNATVGAFFVTKRLAVQGLVTKIQIWDTAGQEQFKRLAPTYYKNAAAAIICYDPKSPRSLETTRYWVNELRSKMPLDGIVLTICATKCDLDLEVDTHHAELLANEVGALFIRTSAKDNVHVNSMFEKVAARVLHLRELEGGPFIPVTFANTPVNMNGGKPLSPERMHFSPPGSSGEEVHEPSCTIDEKRNDDEDVIDDLQPNDTMDSKCDPSKFVCADARELMEDAAGQRCVIQ